MVTLEEFQRSTEVGESVHRKYSVYSTIWLLGEWQEEAIVKGIHKNLVGVCQKHVETQQTCEEVLWSDETKLNVASMQNAMCGENPTRPSLSTPSTRETCGGSIMLWVCLFSRVLTARGAQPTAQPMEEGGHYYIDTHRDSVEYLGYSCCRSSSTASTDHRDTKLDETKHKRNSS
ncbi:unnamed protein product [Pleuronectes platessa]|uniref:Uncharacterized protein n=1 Tax=Pleuronectes platessa TaxID=8262 RepID=A0A9N7UNF3_PLEPL|nr:unnamed protein product [Pleuronectes platessa]